MQLLFLILLIAIGAATAKLNWLKQSHIKWFNKWIFFVALPSVALANVPKMEINAAFFIPFLCAVGLFLCAILFFQVLLKNKFTDSEKTSLSALGGLGNTSFIGFPIITFLYGADRLSHAVIFDQGTFMLLATGAQLLIAKNNGGVSNLAIAKRILTFPPFVGLVVAMFIPSDWMVGQLQSTLAFLGSTVSPVAMLVVGFQIARFAGIHLSKAMFAGLAFQLFIAPMLVAIALWWLPISKDMYQTCIVEASMAPMVSAGILMIDHDIEPKLSSQFLFWGIILSFFTSTLIWHPITELLLSL